MLESPCINLCQMNNASGLCRGCYRTLDEIAAWARMDDPARRATLAAVARRRLAAQSENSSPSVHAGIEHD